MNLFVRELTPPGRGAVTVLHFSGSEAEAALQALGSRFDPAPDPVRRVRLRLAGEDLDEAIVCALPSGDIELHVHGSPPLVRKLIAHFEADRGSKPRPRTLEEEARDRLAEAPCESAARILLDQAEGALSRELRALATAGPEQVGRAIDALLSRWRVSRRALEPAEVVLAGPANAGKSTLFNALLGERRAIVDAEAGTTRDVLRSRAELGAWPVWLIDTAGEREHLSAATEGGVEREGLERGRRARAAADLVFWVEPWASERAMLVRPPAKAGPRAVLLRTFGDRARLPSDDGITLSALQDPAGARERAASLFRKSLGLPEAPWRSGEGVPISSDQAEAIAALRGLESSARARGLEALLDTGGREAPAASIAREPGPAYNRSRRT